MTLLETTLGTFAPEPGVAQNLARFVRRLLAYNEHINLTAARDEAAVLAHVRDSLELVGYVAEPLVDIGSGGGFPALPLAIATGIRMTLIESVAKKATFLRELVAELDLPVDVLAMRAEQAGHLAHLRGSFGSATARGVGPVPVVLELALPLLKVGGRAVLQRGRFEAAERRATADALLVLGGEAEDEIASGPTGDERRILLVRKTAPTNQRFPRRAGIPAKRPLCSRRDA